MKKFSLSLFLILVWTLFPFKSLALEFSVEEPCSGKTLYKRTLNGFDTNVGQLTIQQLELWGVDYVGSELGIHSLQGTPYGQDALEIINRLEMRSYGWCFSVDGEIPEVLPPYFSLHDKPNAKVTWFFGFAYYNAGEWVSQCEKVSELKPSFICK